jgi:hypothetical protein
MKHPISVSIKPAAAQRRLAGWRLGWLARRRLGLARRWLGLGSRRWRRRRFGRCERCRLGRPVGLGRLGSRLGRSKLFGRMHGVASSLDRLGLAACPGECLLVSCSIACDVANGLFHPISLGQAKIKVINYTQSPATNQT